MIRMLCAVLLVVFLSSGANAATEKPATRLVVVTVDGLRWQELFTGIDKDLMSRRDAGVKRVADHELAKRLWASTPEQRRSRLFPEFWAKRVAEGVLLGNRTQNSKVDSTNQVLKSYPG